MRINIVRNFVAVLVASLAVVAGLWGQTPPRKAAGRTHDEVAAAYLEARAANAGVESLARVLGNDEDLFGVAVAVLHRELRKPRTATPQVSPPLESVAALAKFATDRPAMASAITALATSWEGRTAADREREISDADRVVELGRRAAEIDPKTNLARFEPLLDLEDLPEDSPAAAVLHRDYGRGCTSARRFKEAEASFNELLRRARRLGWSRLEAEAWRGKGRIAQQAGQWDVLLQCGDAQLAALREDPHPESLGHANAQLGIGHRNLGRPEAALTCQRRALASFEAAGNRQAVANALQNIGAVLNGMDGRRDEAVATLKQALEVAIEVHNDRQIAQLETILAQFRDLGSSSRSNIEILERALSLARQRNDAEGVADALFRLGDLSSTHGDHERALACLEECRTHYFEHVNPSLRGQVVFSLGSALASSRRFERALSAFEEAAKMTATAPDPTLHARTLLMIAQVQFQTGNPGLAVGALARVESLAAAHPSMRLGSDLELGRAHLAYAERRIDDAVSRLETLRDASLKDGDRAFAGGVALELAAILAQRRDWDAARRSAASAIELLESVGRRHEATIAMGNLGAIDSMLGRHAEAKKSLFDVIERLGPHGDDAMLAIAHWRLAASEQAMGSLESALAHATTSIAYSRDLNQGLGEDLSRAFFERKGEAVAIAFGCIAALGAAKGEESRFFEDLFRFSEFGRGMALAELLAGGNAIRNLANVDSLAEELSTARLRESIAQRDYDAARAKTPKPQGEELTALRKKIDLADADRQEVMSRIRREHRRVAPLVAPDAVPLADLRRRLDPATAWISFQASNDRLFALVVRHDTTRLVDLGALPIVQAAIERGLKILRTEDSDTTFVCRDLHERLIKPVEPALTGARRLLLCPEGTLAFLPFDALIADNSSGAPERLLERYEFAYLPSATTFALLHDDARARDPGIGYLGLCDPSYPEEGGPAPGKNEALASAARRGLPRWRRLPGTAKEVQAIASLFPENERRVLSREFASREALGIAVQPEHPLRLLHLACHGHHDADRSGRSGLVLAGGEILNIDDLGIIPLAADLTLLSACSSALASVQKGEGAMGLVRGFFLSGSRRILATTSEVGDDAARALIVDFTTRVIKDHQAPATALRAAKLAALNANKALSHPSLWSPFSLWGLPD